EHGAAVWLVNTGWSGGAFGVGQRMSIAHTRAMISAILEGRLRDIPAAPDPTFGVAVPVACPGVPDALLQPRNTWADSAAYDAQARALARRFNENFKQFASQVSPEVAGAGPRA